VAWQLLRGRKQLPTLLKANKFLTVSVNRQSLEP